MAKRDEMAEASVYQKCGYEREAFKVGWSAALRHAPEVQALVSALVEFGNLDSDLTMIDKINQASRALEAYRKSAEEVGE